MTLYYMGFWASAILLTAMLPTSKERLNPELTHGERMMHIVLLSLIWPLGVPLWFIVKPY